MTCPHCYSQFITLIQFDFGMDKSTGYHDKGEVFECRECGKVSTPEEVEDEDVRSLQLAQQHGLVLARSADVIALQVAIRMQEQARLDMIESFVLAREECRMAGRLDWTVN